MEYQKIINLLDNTQNQPSKFRTKNWVEINDESRGTYNVNSQIRLKTTMLKSSLCDYGDAYILVKGTITADGTSAAGDDANNTNKKVIFKNCAPFTNCISEINNTQVDNAKDIDIVKPMYNLIEYSNDYSKTSGSLWKYCKDIPAVNNNDNIVNFNGANATDSFNFKAKITGHTNNDGEIDNVKETSDTKYICRNELDKACFQHDTAYGDIKDLAKRTASEKAFRDKAFNIAKNPKYDGYQRRLASMVYKFFDKKSPGNFQKRTVYSGFKGNIWGADLTDMQSISKSNKGTSFLLCVINIFSKYAWVFPLKDKEGVTIASAFQKILNNLIRKPNKIWVEEGSEFYNSLSKK